MNKPKINYFIDMGMAIAFVLAFMTGILKWPLLFREFAFIRALPQATLTFIHDWSGLAMGLFVIAHLVLHFNWILCMTKNLFAKKGESCDAKK